MLEKLVEKNEAKVQRFLEIIPGALTWAVLLSPIWLGIIAPLAVVFFLTFLAIFWVYRAFLHLVGVFIGYRRYRREMEVNWLKRVRGLWGFQYLQHLILIPVANESYEVLEGTLAALAAQKYPKEKIFLALSVEEKNAPRIRTDLKKLKEKYEGRLGPVWTFVHPRGLPGEAVGAAAINTLILVLSSVTCQMGVHAAEHGQVKRTKGLGAITSWGMREWYTLTFIMGAVFIAGQLAEYITLIGEGHTISSSVYFSAFFIATGFHGLHVTGGLVLFLFTLARTYMARRFTHEQAVTAMVVSYYWHFVDVVWIILFSVIYIVR